MCRVLTFTLVYLTALTTIASLSFDCNDYTFDKCRLNDDAVIETLKDVSEPDCQFYCHAIYNTTCRFFIYDQQQTVCQLVKEELISYIDTCRKVGGPVIPSIHDCKKLQDNCKVFFPFIRQFNKIHKILFILPCPTFGIDTQ